MNTNAAMLTGIGVGAGLVYLFDPDRGRRRRALVRDQVVRAAHKGGDALGATSRDLVNRTRGLAALAARGVRADEGDDEVLLERVRAKLGRYTSHPRAIDVGVREGRVTLSGPILTHEADRLLAAIGRVRGVHDVEDRLDRHDQPGTVPALQGGRTRPGERGPFTQDAWAPTSRLLAGAGGLALVGFGLQRRDWPGALLSAAGAVLVARAATDLDLGRLSGLGGGRRAIEIQKTITIDASVEDVFAFWQQYENFPHFMTHVREVRPTAVADQTHWVVDGPAGVPIEFDAVTTDVVPGQLLAWKTVEGAPVAHAGIVHFEPAGDGATRVHVRFSYNPPAGALGHAAAWLIGADARRLFDDDLLRMKSLIETGRPARDAAQPLR